MNLKRDIARYIHLFLLINLFLPIVARNDILFVFGYRFNMLFWVLYLLFFYPKIFLTRPFKYLLLYIIIYAYFSLTGHYDIDFIWFHNNISPIFLGISIYVFFLYNNDIKGLRRVIYLSIIFIIITSIISIIGNYAYPNASRFLVTPEGHSSPTGMMYRKLGIAGYGFASALPFIIPSLFFKHKETKSNKKYLWLSIVILIFIYVYFAGYTAPLLVAIIGVSFSLIGAKRFKKNIYLIIFIVTIILIIPRTHYANIFYSLSEKVDNEVYKIRLESIAIAFEEGIDVEERKDRTQAEQRLSRYQYNFDIFSKNVFIGSGDEGNFHIYWMNILARYGIIGLIPLVLLIRNQILLNKKILNKDFFFYYLFSVGLFILLGLMKAIQGREMFAFIFLIAPGISYINLFNKKHYQNNIKRYE